MTTMLLSADAAAELEQARQDLVEAGRALHARGLLAGEAGNMSVRLSTGHVLITPSGSHKNRLEPADLVLLDPTGKPLPGQTGRKISSETPMHLAVYAAQPQALAVVHAHPAHATVLAILPGSHNLCVTAEGAAALGPVTRVPYARPGTEALGRLVEQAARHSAAILLACHGALTSGSSLEQAQGRMEILDHVSHIYLETRRLVAPHQAVPTLPEDEARALRALAGFDPARPLAVWDLAGE